MRDRANEIIVNLIRSNDFNECIGKVKPSDLQDDLKAEVSLILLETAPEKIITLSEKKQLNFYTVRIIMNLAFSNTSPFYKKFRTPFAELKGHDKCDDSYYSIIRFEREEREEKALAEIHNLEWYESEMVKLYCNVGTYRGMQRATLIPVKSCHDAVRGAINKIKQRI